MDGIHAPEKPAFQPHTASVNRVAILAVLALLMSLAPAIAAAADNDLDAAVNGKQRTPENVKRDAYRHPKQTLEFFGIRPDMTVVEVFPGGGWYTEILAPYLHDHGHLVEATYPMTTDSPFLRRMAKRFRQKLTADPEVYGRVELQAFAPPDYIVLGPPGSADMILTFRNMHDLVYGNPHGTITNAVIERFFRAAYLALKPGGVLGVVGHRAADSATVSDSFRKGRLPQDYVVRMARRAGFQLAAASDINANPKDPRDVPVWYLPPTLNAPKGQREKFRDIGESDRMTLKFMKPAEE